MAKYWGRTTIVSKFVPIAFGLLIAACGDDASGDGSGRGDGSTQDGGGNRSDSGRPDSGGAGSGAVNECRNASANDCDEHATCTDTAAGYECECNGPAYEGDGKSCECADGYTEVDGACVADNGGDCSEDDQCSSGHCVDGICCASACDEPGACQVAEGASCSDGETCEYPQADDGASCEDGDRCTENDVCEDGECTAGGALDCDDDNICTADSCDPDSEEDDPCIHNGEGITTAGCREDDACGTNYRCTGVPRGDCEAEQPVACNASVGACEENACDPVEGCIVVDKDEGAECDDGNACTLNESCNDGVCGDGDARVCDDGQVCTDETCDPNVGCVPTFNTSSCDDDNECTSGDVCNQGQCAGVNSVVCPPASDVCHDVGVCNPTTGQCSNPAKPNSPATSCDDQDNCTPQDVCVDGTCTGTGDTCTGECQADPSPCDDNAICTDSNPTAPGGVTCTCKNGYRKVGNDCVDIDECMGNPCGAGRGTCSQPTLGTYDCACNTGAGFMKINTPTGPTCACNMNGTFAFKTTATVSWAAVPWTDTTDLLEGGMGETVSWGIRVQTYTADGRLSTVIRACSGTAPDICDSNDTGLPIFPDNEAYQQYEPNSFYDDRVVGANEPPWTLLKAYGGQPFVTPATAVLMGIDLADDYGDWPASRDDVGGTNPTNGAAWVTYGEGMARGVTTLVVKPGGVSTGAPRVFPPVSEDCPRESNETAEYRYAYLPNPTLGLFGPRIVSVQSGSRLTSWLEGHFDENSCDRITGDVVGPDDGHAKFEGRFDNCRVEAANDMTAPCSEAVIDALDAEPQSQEIIDATFVMERVPDNYTCQQARDHNYAATP